MNEQDNPEPAQAEHRHPDTRESLRQAALALVQSARRELMVVSPVLDAALWNSAAMGEALGRFISRSRNNHARLVVEDTEHMLVTCTRLVELARRFSDLLLIRRLGEPHRGLNQMFMIADGDSCIVQQDIGVMNATLDLHKPQVVAPLAVRFEEIWGAADPAPGLHIFRL